MLKKCVVCESDKIVKNQGWLGDLTINCEACGALLSVPLLVSAVQNDKEEQNDIPKYHLWLSEEKEMHEVHAFDSDSEDIRKMIQSGEAVLLEPAQITTMEGLELFEGDIVRLTSVLPFHEADEEVCVIRKSEQHVGLVFYSIETGEEQIIFYRDSYCVSEYLGNIYLTPEVIEEELFKMKQERIL